MTFLTKLLLGVVTVGSGGALVVGNYLVNNNSSNLGTGMKGQLDSSRDVGSTSSGDTQTEKNNKNSLPSFGTQGLSNQSLPDIWNPFW